MQLKEWSDSLFHCVPLDWTAKAQPEPSEVADCRQRGRPPILESEIKQTQQIYRLARTDRSFE